ncbi:MAG TPA: response regulator transcription factor [Kofleriaceae bacterium]|jgi:DNA-binding NarL/FixJ family response regulator
MTAIRCLVVDDHPIVRRGLRELLTDEFPGVELVECETGEAAVSQVDHGNFDVALLDLSMPGRGGLDALKEIHARRPRLPVLVHTQHAEQQYAIRALRAGARGYITKDTAPDELVRAVREVVAGRRYVTPALAAELAAVVAADPTRAPHDTLSDRELQVLQMIGVGKTVSEIAAELGLSDKTISTYRSRVLEKLQLRTTADLMRYALKSSLVD